MTRRTVWPARQVRHATRADEPGAPGPPDLQYKCPCANVCPGLGAGPRRTRRAVGARRTLVLDLGHVVQLRTYVVNLDFDKLGAIALAVRGGCGNTPPTQTVIGVAGLAMPEILFEVGAVAARP